MSETDSFFGGAPALSWPKADANHVYSDVRLRGVSRGGVITKDPVIQQMTAMGSGEPLWWDRERTRAKMQMVVTVLCDGRGGALDERTGPQDRGERRLYIRGYMVAAVREALQSASAEGLRVGGEIYVAWIGEQPSKTPNFDPARLYAAKYVPPSVAIPDGGAKTQPTGAGQQAASPFQQAVLEGQAQAAQTVGAMQQAGYQGPAYAPPAAPARPPWEQPAPGGAPAGPPPATPFQPPAPAPAGPAPNPYA